MRYADFQNLSEGQPKDPKVGDLFLDGNLIEQKASKMKEGDQLTMYKIIKVGLQDYGSVIEYVPIYDVLEY